MLYIEEAGDLSCCCRIKTVILKSADDNGP